MCFQTQIAWFWLGLGQAPHSVIPTAGHYRREEGHPQPSGLLAVATNIPFESRGIVKQAPRPGNRTNKGEQDGRYKKVR